jgi:hypothetical protein
MRTYNPIVRTLALSIGLLVAFGVAVFAESAAGLRWSAPAGWTSQGTLPMRAATYSVVAVSGDRDNAECGIYFFGAGQGGSVEANIERWKGQFRGPDKSPATARVAKRAVRGIPITTIDVSGEYSGTGGPFGGGPLKPGYRLLGAIVEGPGGNIFVKFTGPAKTITSNQQKFDQLLASFEKAK